MTLAFLILVIVLIVLAGLAVYAIGFAPIAEPFKRAAQALIVLALVIYLLYRLSPHL